MQSRKWPFNLEKSSLNVNGIRSNPVNVLILFNPLLLQSVSKTAIRDIDAVAGLSVMILKMLKNMITLRKFIRNED